MKKKIAPKMNNEEKQQSRKTGFYYSFLTVVLVFCFIQIGYGAILNVSKIISYHGKKATLEQLLEQSKMRNEDLKAEREIITSDNSLEGIARNNLKMAKKDEVLVIINKRVEKPKRKKCWWKLKNINLDIFKYQPEEDVKPIETPYIPKKFDEE